MCKNNYEGTPNYPDYNCSVRFGKGTRFDKAKSEVKKQKVAIDVIIDYVNDFYEKLGMDRCENPIFKNPPISNDSHRVIKDEFYELVKDKYNINDAKDIVWMIFTKDGYLGLVALSNDINFDIAKNESDYKAGKNDPNYHHTKGILVHYVGKEWDESFVLVFPLKNIPSELNRHEVERGIGNYLISKNVPIIDFYSHNY